MPGLFDEFVRSSPRVASRQRYVIPLSVLAHAVLLALVIVVPLLAAGALPMPASVLVFTTPAASPPPPPPPPARAPAAAATVEPRADAVPIAEPPRIVAEPPASRSLSTVAGVDGGIPWGADGGTGLGLGQPPPPATPAPATHEPVHPGGQIKEPTRVHYVAPVYPRLALAAKSEGVVLIEAELDTTGAVTSARVIRSVALLDAAALDAVRQWKYTPTLLNGVPVPVLMTVTVIFTLK